MLTFTEPTPHTHARHGRTGNGQHPGWGGSLSSCVRTNNITHSHFRTILYSGSLLPHLSPVFIPHALHTVPCPGPSLQMRLKFTYLCPVRDPVSKRCPADIHTSHLTPTAVASTRVAPLTRHVHTYFVGLVRPLRHQTAAAGAGAGAMVRPSIMRICTAFDFWSDLCSRTLHIAAIRDHIGWCFVCAQIRPC